MFVSLSVVAVAAEKERFSMEQNEKEKNTIRESALFIHSTTDVLQHNDDPHLYASIEINDNCPCKGHCCQPASALIL
jgi:hypothetical protein